MAKPLAPAPMFKNSLEYFLNWPWVSMDEANVIPIKSSKNAKAFDFLYLLRE
jgi:hypothetical protein